MYRKHFAAELKKIIIQDNPAEDQTKDFAQTLARKYARNEPDAVEKVDEILASIGLNTDDILRRCGQASKLKDSRTSTRGANRAPSS